MLAYTTHDHVPLYSTDALLYRWSTVLWPPSWGAHVLYYYQLSVALGPRQYDGIRVLTMTNTKYVSWECSLTACAT